MKRTAWLLALLIFVPAFVLFGCGKSFTVTFESNGGTYSAPVDFSGKEELAMPENPTKEGYVFDGWYLDNNTFSKEITKSSFANSKLTNDLVLFAKWVAVPYTLSFNSNGGTAITPIRKDFGTNFELPTAPTKEPTTTICYTFAGWFSDVELTQAVTWPMVVAGDMTVYAKWTESPRLYTLTYNMDGGNAIVEGNASQTQYEGEISVPTSTPTKEDDIAGSYVFAGWFNEPNFETEVVWPVAMTEDITVYAKWTCTYASYDISFDTNGGSAIVATNGEYNSTINQPADPTLTLDYANSCDFAGWYTDEDLTTEVVWPYTIEGEATLYAKWNCDYKEYILTYDYEDARPDTATTQKWGTKIEKPADPTRAPTDEEITFFEFAGWYTDNTYATPVVWTHDEETDKDYYTLESNVTFYAKWTTSPREYVITFNTLNGEANTTTNAVYNASLTKPETEPVKSNTSAYCYEFEGWYLDSNLTTAIVWPLVITKAETIYAKYTELPTVCVVNEVYYSSLNDAVESVLGTTAVITLLNDCSLTESIIISDAATDITINSSVQNSYVISRGVENEFLFVINAGKLSLGLKDKNVVVDGNKSNFATNTHSLIQVNAGTFVIKNANLINNFATNGSAVILDHEEAVFTMMSGSISLNSATGRGGAVAIMKGKFEINAGTIQNNLAQSEIGHSVYLASEQKFIIGGGSISGTIYIHNIADTFITQTSQLANNIFTIKVSRFVENMEVIKAENASVFGNRCNFVYEENTYYARLQNNKILLYRPITISATSSGDKGYIGEFSKSSGLRYGDRVTIHVHVNKSWIQRTCTISFPADCGRSDYDIVYGEKNDISGTSDTIVTFTVYKNMTIHFSFN